MEACARCGEPGPHRFFAVAMGGFVCAEHRPPGAATVSPPAGQALVALMVGDWAVADAVEPKVQREVSGVVSAYLQWQLERGLRSLPLVERT